ncbi:MAG: hypothetical protein JWR83_220 [Aeromicrobium sp.]|nr:hypothetical protein [Aeromicrobium sp.]
MDIQQVDALSSRRSGGQVDDAAVERLSDHVRSAVDSGLIPGAQVAVAAEGRLVLNEAYGDLTTTIRCVLQSTGRPVVAAVVWQLLDRGLVRLDELVADIIPEFDSNGKNAVTVEHILTHRAGFPFAPLGYPKMLDRHDRLAAFGRWKLDYEPGTRLQFHLTSAAWVIAEIVERRAGMPIGEYISSQFSDPLDLTLQLGVPVEDQGSVAAMMVTDRVSDDQEVDPWGPWYLSRPEVLAAGEPSHSLVGSAADLALFYQAANGGLICSEETLAEATRIRFTEVPAGEQLYGGSEIPVSMGLFVTVAGAHGGNWMPTAGSPRTWGHGGAAYQLAFIDPETGISMACLSNGYPLSGYDYSDRGLNYLTTLANLGASLAL